MAFTPITGAWLQLSSAVNNLALDHYIKFYDAGTPNTFSMATDSTGGTLLAKAKINSKGFPISNPSNEDTTFTPNIDRDYRLIIYTNEADADANTVANALVDLDDNIQQIAPVSDPDFIDIGGLTLTQQDDYWKSPLYNDGNGFVSGAGPHTIIIKTSNVDDAVWDPTDSDFRSYRINSSGLITDLTPTATTSTSFTIPDTLSSTDTIFHGDDLVRFIRRTNSIIDNDEDTLVTGEALKDAIGATQWQYDQKINKQLTAPNSLTVCVAFDGTNLISGSRGAGNFISVHQGVSEFVQSSFVSQGQITGMTFDGTNLITTSTFTNFINFHVGVSATVTTTLSKSANDVAWVNGNLITIDSGTDLITVLDGFSTTVLRSFPTPGTSGFGITFDGVNLITCDNGDDKIYVHDGISESILYSFDFVISGNGAGMTIANNELVITLSTNDDISLLKTNPIGPTHSDAVDNESRSDTATSKAVFDAVGLDKLNFSGDAESILDFSDVAQGFTFFNGDLIRITGTGGTITVYDGVSDTVLFSFAAPSANTQDLTIANGNLVSLDFTNDEINIHTGISSGITDNFSSPATSPVGIAFDGTNLISADDVSDLIYIHVGITASTSSSFAAPSTAPQTLEFHDGNLISTDFDTNLVYHHDAITSTIAYTHSGGGASSLQGVAVLNNVLYTNNSNDDDIYRHGRQIQLSDSTSLDSSKVGASAKAVKAVKDNVSDSITSSSSTVFASSNAARLVDVGIRGDLSDSIISSSSTVFASSNAVRLALAAIVLTHKQFTVASFAAPASDITGITFDTSAKNIISCDASADLIYIHLGMSSTISSSFASPGSGPFGLAFDGTNLISCDSTSSLIYIHSGVTSTISSSFSTPGSVIRGLTFDTETGNLISCDADTETIYIHSGITSTISSSFASPGSSPTGLTFDSTNLISCDAVSDLIYIHSGVTSTVSSSFSTPATVPLGLAFDDTNLISVDNLSNTIYIHGRGIEIVT